MFKKSIIIVIIQVFGSILGLLNIYLIAGDMAPEVYSLIGIYTVVSNIVLTFSDVGIETTMMRETLYWIEQNQNQRVKEFATQAVLSRILGFIVLLPLIAAYIVYLCIAKYSVEYHLILVLFIIGSFVSALNNSMTLIVRSEGGYVFSQIASTANNYFLKFAGIGLYFWKGEKAYLYFYAVSAVPLFFVYLIKSHKSFDLKEINIRSTLKKIWKAKYLWLKTDLDYLKNNADSFLVSAIFPTSVMGSYTIYKSLEQIAKNFVEGFFDVLSQHMVKYKGNKEKLQASEKKIKFARNIIIGLICAGCGVLAVYSSKIISLIRLSKYENMTEMLMCVAVVSICYLIGKYEINTVAFFGSSKLNFQLGIVTSIISLVTFGIVALISNIYGVLLQRVMAYLLTSIVAIVFFYRYREKMYTEIMG